MALMLMLVVSGCAGAYALQPPAWSLDYEAHSARNYMILERDFVKRYLFDNSYGATYFSVGGKGNVLDPSKDVIFQANIILFLAGMNFAQSPDPEIVRYVDSAAAFIVKYLKWGPDGPGTWYSSSNRTGSNPQAMIWLAPSEAYVSYALLWAYEITRNRIYLDVARTNLDYQMTQFPDGHIMTNARAHSGDVSYRSPERMAHYLMWQVTGNQSYLNYAKKFQNTVFGSNGWERRNVNGTEVRLYVHGNAVRDELDYAFVSGDNSALSEGRQLVESFWAQGGGGRDYDQDVLAMDLTLWTITQETRYHDDGVRIYNDLLKFWDPSPPYGFWAGLDKVTKTCFSRGYPMIDMTPPIIEADPERQKITAKILDPNYQWLNMTLKGIGVNPQSVYLFYSLDSQTWSGSMRMQTVDSDSYTAIVPPDVTAKNPLYLISASDYFNNTSRVEFTKPPITAPTTIVSTTSTTVPVVPVVASSTSPFGLGFAVIAMTGLAAGALIAAIALVYWRRPVPLAGGLGHSACRCPYWWECYREHYDCPSCNEMRASGRCCMCIPEGLRPGYCNHPPLDYRYTGQ